MNCPNCKTHSLDESLTKEGVLIDACKSCKGIWLDRGKIFHFSRRPRQLEESLASADDGARTSERACPRCASALEVVPFLRPGLEVDRCPRCEGYWFDAGELRAAIEADQLAFRLETPMADDDDFAPAPGWPRRSSMCTMKEPRHDGATWRRGCSPCRTSGSASAGVLALLYGIMGLVLITLAQLGMLTTGVAVGIGAAIIVLQFVLGPWLMDMMLRWIYKFSWVPVDQLPEHLHEFVTRVCAEQGMKVPSFGLIHDGAPNAFTYGHTPNNMRVVITQGILDLLEPAEVEGVVAHELGHGKNWDMLLMTVVQLVPLTMYFLYRTAMQFGGRGKDGGYRVAVAVGAYVLYIASEYIVLWFSRCREYYADRFAGRVTGNPHALASCS